MNSRREIDSGWKWPEEGRVRQGWLWLVTSSIVTVSAAAWVIAFSACESRTMKVEDVEQLIDENLASGSGLDEIVAFLESHDIDHGSVRRAGDYSVLKDYGVAPETMVIASIIRDTSQGLFVDGDIQIFFILDDDRRLQRYIVREVFTGL